ncbi:MAG TPA: APC family permease [Jatrophihabitans sp.]|jgi:amino acid transporter|uniref:APC family permease n=1 Tax=Jatrophihabitans sp. TaxID=1932789 RepID=UPI002E060384|nr:APC family permease [Jatrophihabitans sp.]
MTTLTKPTSDTGPAEGNMRRDIGVVGLLFAGVGSIIGSGWLFGALNASQIAGPAAVFSWVIGAIMILLIGLCFAELGAMFPLTGGVIRFPHLSFGSFASYTMGWINWIAAATVAPIEVEGALQYATKYAAFTKQHTVAGGATVHTLTGLGYVVAVIAMAVFVVVNYYGIRWFARVNNVAVWWKLAVITLVIFAFLLTEFRGGNFTSHGFAPQGTHGMLTAIATGGITFSFLGFRQGVELAGESNNPRRNVPIAVIGSVLITGVIYVLLQIAFIGAVDPKDLSKGWSNLDFANSFGPLAAIATLLGLGWLATILYIDAIISPADTGLIYTTVTGRITYAMSKNRNAPEALGRTTSRGVPLVSLIVTFFVGLIVFLPFPSWQQLVGFITSATVLSFGSGPVVLAAMRRQIPDVERPFKLPFGDTIPFLAFFSSNLIVYWAGWDVNWKLFTAVALGFVLLGVFHAIGGGTKGGMPHLQWKAGATWSLPWLGGLCLISYLGDYPEQSKAAGNTGTIGFGWGFLVLFGLSIVVWAIAMAVRLPGDEVRRNIEETKAEAAEEEAELGASH